jgi:hypothetical protein
MEFMKLRPYTPACISVMLVSLVLCVGCAPNKIKGNPPFVAISSMMMTDEALSASFDVRNINEVPMTIDAVDITISTRGSEFSSYSGAYQLSLDPNTTEEVTLDKLPGDYARGQLAELQGGKIASLPFSLQGRVHTTEDGYLDFRHEGYLYTVPGKPGQFRSATSRTREE